MNFSCITSFVKFSSVKISIWAPAENSDYICLNWLLRDHKKVSERGENLLVKGREEYKEHSEDEKGSDKSTSFQGLNKAHDVAL